MDTQKTKIFKGLKKKKKGKKDKTESHAKPPDKVYVEAESTTFIFWSVLQIHYFFYIIKVLSRKLIKRFALWIHKEKLSSHNCLQKYLI